MKYLLSDGGFTVRGITRNPDSPQAIGEHSRHPPFLLCKLNCKFYEALKEKGVQVVKATFDDVERLTKAFEGADGVFGVTNCEFLS